MMFKKMELAETSAAEESSFKCFICSANIDPADVPVILGASPHWKTGLSSKIEQLLGSGIMIVVGEDDTICQRCSLLLTHCDQLETDLHLLQQSVKEFLNAKYDLKSLDGNESRHTIHLDQEMCVTNNIASNELVYNNSSIPEQKLYKEAVNPFVNCINSGVLDCQTNSYLPISLFKCKYCDYKTRERPNLMNHLKLHSKKVIYKCSKCDRKFMSRSEVEKHIIYVHRTSSTVMPQPDKSFQWKSSATKTFQCTHCSATFHTNKDLLTHEEVHRYEEDTSESMSTVHANFQIIDVQSHDDQQSQIASYSSAQSPESNMAVSDADDNLQCEYDSVETMLGQLHSRAMQVHEDDPTNEDQDESQGHIEITGSELSSIALLNQLQEEAQMEQQENTADLCITTSVLDEGFKTPNILKKIMPKYIDPPKEKILICSRCGLRTTSKAHMKRHVNCHVALNKRTYACHICSKVLTTRSNLKRHVGNHDLVPVSCGICNQQLTDRLHRKQHMEECHAQQYTCPMCDQAFATQHLRKSHELTHREIFSFRCSVFECNEVFNTEIQLQNHRSSKHGLQDLTYESAFKCHICCKILTSFHNLRRHMLNHDKSTGNVECNVCQLQVTDRLHLRHHMEENHPGSFQCMFCPQMFSSKKSCNSHELTHPERLFHKCDVCLEEFPNLRRLKKHKETSHREPRCRICDKEIKNIYKLIEHEKRHVKYYSKFNCTTCDKQFLTPSGLRYHMAVHTGIYNYFCDICKKGFNSLSVLAEHKATHTKEARYTCERCGRNFSSNSTYRIHRLWHDNPFPYKCNICERKFKHTSLLAVHKRRAHTGERPYKCPYCSFAFNVSSSFKKHIILHTRNYPYKCTHCDKGFTTRSKVAQHLARTHDDFSVQNEKPKECEYKMVLKPDEQPQEQIEGEDGEVEEEEGEGEGEETECIEQEEQISFVTLETVNATEHAIYAIFESPS